MKTSGLGRGLASLIPKKDEQIISMPSGASNPSGAVLEVPIARVRPNPRQPREHFSASELEDLVASIEKHGIIQPLVVSTTSGGEYELIAGERRLRAAKSLGLKRVPVVIRSAGEQEKLELALIENIQRQDLNALEEARAYISLSESFNLTQEEIASRVGKSRSFVANTIRLLELPERMKRALVEGRISRSHARTLLAEEDEYKRGALFEAMLGGAGITVREAEARAGIGRGSKSRRGAKDPNLAAHEVKLRELYGTKVSILGTQKKGKIILEYYSREELLSLLDHLTD